MVIWKPNRKYIKKATKAKVIDMLKLQNQHPERMEKAIKFAKEYEMEFDRICLIKVWDDWYVYGLFASETLMENAILVNSKEDIHYGNVFLVEGEGSNGKINSIRSRGRTSVHQDRRPRRCHRQSAEGIGEART